MAKSAAKSATAPATARQQPQQTKEVARAADTTVSTEMPDFMKKYAGAGKENIGMEDVVTPRLKLMQGLSPELQLYDGLRAGYFWHTTAEHIFSGPFVGVPIYMDRRYILWRPRDMGGGILARADDGIHWSPSTGEFTVTLDKKDGGRTVTWKMAKTVKESGLHEWGTSDPEAPGDKTKIPPAATLVYNYVLAFPDFPDMIPAVLSFQRSAVPAARRFNSKIQVNAESPLFRNKYLFTPVIERNQANKEFFNVSVTGAGTLDDQPALFEKYAKLYDRFAQKGLQVKDEDTMANEEDTIGGETNDEGGRRY